jgi:tetratricopeptide (TPR) repeat protein
VEDEHLSLDLLAKLLSGGMEHEVLLGQVVPHFLARCPVCRERHQEILRLQEEMGHWNEEVAVLESREAPGLWARLAAQPYAEQVRRVEEDEGLHAWGLCQLLLTKSREAVFDHPALAVDLANLAVKVTAHLGEAYDPAWVLDLKARAFAYLGNALRVLGELRSAEEAFQKAEKCLAQSGTGNARIEAEVLDLQSSLRRAQRRLEESLELVDRALLLHRESNDSHRIGKALLKKAKVLEEMGDLDEAINLLRHSEIDPAIEPRLFAYSCCNLGVCLTLAGRYEEAELLLPEIRELLRDAAQPVDLVRLRWIEGNIHLGLGRIGPAEASFREVQREFLARQMGYDAALVSLDLAALYAQEDCHEDLKRLAAELMPIFEARDIPREALGTLLLFQRACEEELMTVALARELSEYLRRERRTGG